MSIICKTLKWFHLLTSGYSQVSRLGCQLAYATAFYMVLSSFPQQFNNKCVQNERN